MTSNPFDETVIENATLAEAQHRSPNIFYTITEILVALFAIVGNSLVITVFWKERRLRRRTNYYIVSLATADLLVGLLGIPFALLASVGLPTNLHACLFTVSLLVVLCTISIFCLVAVSVDRYWAILYPMGYSRHVRTKTALVIISICWFAGCIIGFLPLMGWHQDVEGKFQCFFLRVMDYHYLVFLYFVTIITPALLLAAFYTHIYRVVLKQLRQIVTMNPENGTATTGRTPGGTMLRVLGAQQKREVKATQNLSFIVLFFMICWIPLYTINFILAFCKQCFEVNSTFMLFCVILSHLNSAGNPLLYAYHLRDFRAALKNYLYSIFGLVDPAAPVTGVNGRPSQLSYRYPSHYNHRHMNAIRESRSAATLPQQRFYSESQLSLHNRLMNKSHSLPNHPNIASIVTQTATLAAAPAGETAREIWRISEVPSISEEHSKELSHDSKWSKNQRNFSEGSEKVNDGFVEATTELEIGDDDVFFDDYAPNEELSTNSSVSSGSIPNDVTALQSIRKMNLSSSSPQLNRGLFVVEAETNKHKRGSFGRSISAVESNDGRLQKTFSGECIHSPIKSLKAVGDFILHRGLQNSKSTTKLSLSDDSSVIVDECLRKENSIGVN